MAILDGARPGSVAEIARRAATNRKVCNETVSRDWKEVPVAGPGECPATG
ncbi:MAG: hypothetical protein L0Y50_05720 [Beijerinckiaceae bacterium]|nr:hypothetical protein [Beijerinckiaceae bacterium]MCI0735757.1 hypothetical protein [Beijerinckiaceae bacterium]